MIDNSTRADLDCNTGGATIAEAIFYVISELLYDNFRNATRPSGGYKRSCGGMVSEATTTAVRKRLLEQGLICGWLSPR